MPVSSAAQPASAPPRPIMARMNNVMTRPRCDHAPAWAALREHFEAVGSKLDLRDAFRQGEGRFQAFSQHAPHVFADLSRNLIDTQSQALLMELARECGLERHR